MGIVSQHGHTVIPAEICKRYNIEAGDHLVWVDDGFSIRVIPILLPITPVATLNDLDKGLGLHEEHASELKKGL